MFIIAEKRAKSNFPRSFTARLQIFPRRRY